MTHEFNTNYQKASRKRRLAAFMIDHFIFTFLIVCCTFAASGTGFLNDTDPFGYIPVIITALLGFTAYFSKDCIKGQSPGKWFLQLKVRKKNNLNEIPSVRQLLLRNVFLIIWPIELIVLITSSEKERLADKQIGTVVIKSEEAISKTPRIALITSFFMVFFAFIFLFISSAIKNSDAYKMAQNEIENNSEIIETTGGIEGYDFFPKGSVSTTNGEGEAYFTIGVKGKTTDVNVNITLYKEMGSDWIIDKFNWTKN
ncbi:RDD family protein [Roseivirga sp.]|uniref:RDD family protein n=1 Tax=Roseivirga sp. TaxID=1964215 RepID=UPI003B8C7024